MHPPSLPARLKTILPQRQSTLPPAQPERDSVCVQTWRNEVTKLLDFLDPSESGAGLALAPQTVVFPQKLRAGNAALSLTVPRTAFVQRRKGLYGVTYSASLANGSPLPSWLTFRANEIRLSASFVTLEGWSDVSNVTNAAGEWTAYMAVNVNAIDPISGRVALSIPFALNWRTPPAVMAPLPDASLEWGAAREFNLTGGVFRSSQPNVTLTYDVELRVVSPPPPPPPSSVHHFMGLMGKFQGFSPPKPHWPPHVYVIPFKVILVNFCSLLCYIFGCLDVITHITL